MSTNTEEMEELVGKDYEHGFVTDIDADTVEPGLNEDVIAFISKKKEEPEWLLEWRLKAYRQWLTMDDPTWAHLDIAGKAWSDSATAIVPKGGTGYGVRLLNRLIDDWQGANILEQADEADG